MKTLLEPVRIVPLNTSNTVASSIMKPTLSTITAFLSITKAEDGARERKGSPGLVQRFLLGGDAFPRAAEFINA